MSQKIDDMFARDLEKVGKGMPSELALNAAKVKASQDDEKEGAEKPDLYAKGKGKGKDGKDSSEKNEERKSKGKNKGEKKDKIPPQFRSKLDANKKKDCEKKASLDDKFAADLHQAVGLDVPESDPDFVRPDVNIDGQTEDAIDDHFLGWMHEKADEDVVKEAVGPQEIARDILQSGKVNDGARMLQKHMRSAQLKGAAKAAAGIGITGGAAVVGYKKGRKSTGVSDGSGYEKQAKLVENPDNVDLLARIRRMAQNGGSGDA